MVAAVSAATASASTATRSAVFARHSAPGPTPVVELSVQPAPVFSMSVWRLAITATRTGWTRAFIMAAFSSSDAHGQASGSAPTTGASGRNRFMHDSATTATTATTTTGIVWRRRIFAASRRTSSSLRAIATITAPPPLR